MSTRLKQDDAAEPVAPEIPGDNIEKALQRVADRLGLTERPSARVGAQEARPKSPISDSLEMPFDDEDVSWRGKFRAEVPDYVMEQVFEYAHKKRCTVAHLLLNMMRGYRDENGPAFYIRRRDCLVTDRRKAKTRRESA